jgi:hypothetical protein
MVRGYDALPFANERIRRKVMYENAARLLSEHGVRLDGATTDPVRQPS